MPKPILIIEDDPDIAESLRYNFERDKFTTRLASTGEEGLAASLDAHNPPALIVLDLMLPGLNGLEVCRRIRREPATRRIPIIMVTALAHEADITAGLELGADDYVTKPFSVREVLARARAILRRAEENAPHNYEDTRLRIDYAERRVVADGASVRLPRKEFDLLILLVSNKGRVMIRQRLLDEVWGYRGYGDERTLDVHIRRLRANLGECSAAIETVVGLGYRFAGSPSEPTQI